MRTATAAVVAFVTEGAIVAAAVLAAAALAGLAWRGLNGRMRARLRAGGAGPPRLTAADIGQPLGTTATLLQFSSPVCAPCRAARLLLADVAAATPGVTHVELDVSSRMELVRRFGIRRTPTVFVLDRRGEVAQRASGAPKREDVLSALALAAGDQQIGSDRGVPHT
jgi:thiol-disulfide isomerase/thioredoxin